jgi:acetyl-CoA carboxylase biotin carboxyl carrier protein
VLTFEQIKELIDLVCERELQGLEIERSGFRVRIEGKGAAPQPTTIVHAVTPEGPLQQVVVPAGLQSSLAPGVSEATEGSEALEEADLAGLHLLNSPIVGTFYASPNPDADPYVSIGDRVKRGQVICIVEAMKLMNEIESDEDGVIDKIYPGNAQPVEFGERLFAIRTD